MAIKQLIALCLVFAVTFVHALPEAAPEAEAEAEAFAEAEADAEADAWYGYYGGHGYGHGYGLGYGLGYGHGLGYGGYRPYGYGHHYHHRRPYHYKPRPVPEVVNHVAPIAKTYGYRTLPEVVSAPVVAPPAPAPEPSYVRHQDPIVVPEPEPYVIPEPEPVVAPEPEPEVRSSPVPVHPVFLTPEESAAYAAFMPVPAVPEGHFGTFSAPPVMIAPAPISRASQIVPVFDNEVEDILKIAPAPVPELPPVLPEVARNDIDIDVIESADPIGEAPAAPVPVFDAPIEAPAPVQGVVASQYHAQDEFGNVVYGYSNPNSAKSEQRDAYGNVMGYYSYVDDTGYPKHVSYVADDFGFRITNANNFPVAPNAIA